MNYAQEQAQEIETLSYIYIENELNIESEIKFQINIRSEEDCIWPVVQEEESEWIATLHVEYTPTYPEEMPLLDLESIYLYDQEIEQLKQEINEQCKEALGDAMIYTISTWLRDRMEVLIKDRTEREEREDDEAKEKLEAEEKKRYQGTPVTKESFMHWQKTFIEEAKQTLKQGKPVSTSFQAALAIEKAIGASSKPTGKQLFERDMQLIKSDEQYGDEGAEVEVDVSLLQGMQNLDVEDENSVLAGFSEDD
jgi:hypothetical protein